MSEMVERVARAMFEADKAIPATASRPVGGWDDRTELGREAYRTQARFVIAAMREPTEAMIKASTFYEGVWERNGVSTWQTMIDAGLK